MTYANTVIDADIAAIHSQKADRHRLPSDVFTDHAVTIDVTGGKS